MELSKNFTITLTPDEELYKFFDYINNMSSRGTVFATTGQGDICECYLKIQI